MSGHESRARMVDEYLLNFGAKDVVPEAEEQSADGCRIGRELACFDLAPCCASRRCRGLRCGGWFAVSWCCKILSVIQRCKPIKRERERWMVASIADQRASASVRVRVARAPATYVHSAFHKPCSCCNCTGSCPRAVGTAIRSSLLPPILRTSEQERSNESTRASQRRRETRNAPAAAR